MTKINDYGFSLFYIRYATWSGYKAFAISLVQFAVDINDNDRERALLSYRYEKVDGNVTHTVNVLYLEFEF